MKLVSLTFQEKVIREKTFFKKKKRHFFWKGQGDQLHSKRFLKFDTAHFGI